MHYKDLVFRLKSDLEGADIFLLKKEFEFFRNKNTSTIWILNRNESDNKASEFIAKFCDKPYCPLWYQTSNKQFIAIRDEIKAIGYKVYDDPNNEEYIQKLGGGIRTVNSNGQYDIDFT